VTLAQLSPATITWSRNRTPTAMAASASAVVAQRFWLLGSAVPPGWLCTTAKATPSCRRTSARISRDGERAGIHGAVGDGGDPAYPVLGVADDNYHLLRSDSREHWRHQPGDVRRRANGPLKRVTLHAICQGEGRSQPGGSSQDLRQGAGRVPRAGRETTRQHRRTPSAATEPGQPRSLPDDPY